MENNYRVITTTSESSTYIDFWPTVAMNWKKTVGIEKITLGFITERKENDPYVKEMRKYGDVDLIKPIKGIPIGNQAKATRMYLASLFPDEYCILADIDMYLLDSKKAWEEWFSVVNDNNFIAVAPNAYYDTPEEGKFPMCYTTAKGSTFQKVINPNRLTYEDLLMSWRNMNIFDNKESITNDFYNFSDESLLRALLYIWENKGGEIKYVEREDFYKMKAARRIDRANWGFDPEKLKNGHYIDCNPLRPLRKNIKKVEPVLNYLNIDKEHWLI